jgi:hypothetical protein
MRELIDNIDTVRAASVQKETWGHLAPKPMATYTGYIVFAVGEYGDTMVVRSHFRSEKAGVLSSSPWYYQDEQDFVSGKRQSVGIYRFEGTYTKRKEPDQCWMNAPCKFEGTIRRLEMR